MSSFSTPYVFLSGRAWRDERLRDKHRRLQNDEPCSSDDSDVELDATTTAGGSGGGGFRVPSRIWRALYRYQRTGVKWLWELHAQQCGGIVGDEMGLGKTIQVIAFLVALKHSQTRDKGNNAK